MVKYNFAVLNLFFSYIKGQLTEDQLARKLYSIEDDALEERDWDEGIRMWFQADRQDTLSTNIEELTRELKHGTKRNRDFYMEWMERATQSNDFRVHFS